MQFIGNDRGRTCSSQVAAQNGLPRLLAGVGTRPECRAGSFSPIPSFISSTSYQITTKMTSHFSSDSAISRTIRVSATARRSYDPLLPNQPWGYAYRFDYKTLNANFWLCIGLSYGELDRSEWYFGADAQGDWFSLGLPVEVWQDAVVIDCSIPGRFIVVPDAFFVGVLPQRLRLRKFFMGRWLPSVAQLVTI